MEDLALQLGDNGNGILSFFKCQLTSQIKLMDKESKVAGYVNLRMIRFLIKVAVMLQLPCVAVITNSDD